MESLTFLAELSGDPKHRITIDYKVWKYLDLHEGDIVEVTIKKIKESAKKLE